MDKIKGGSLYWSSGCLTSQRGQGQGPLPPHFLVTAHLIPRAKCSSHRSHPLNLFLRTEISDCTIFFFIICSISDQDNVPVGLFPRKTGKKGDNISLWELCPLEVKSPGPDTRRRYEHEGLRICFPFSIEYSRKLH